MIDTIAFLIKIDEKLFDRIKKKSLQTERKNNSNDQLLYRFYQSDVKLGSYERNFNIFLNDNYKETLRIEFSIPKYYFGHNVFMFYLSKLEKTMEKLKCEFEEEFGKFPEIASWKVQRLDICYAWKFPSEDHVYTVLEILDAYKYPRQTKANFGTSLMFRGESYSSKFYMKAPEFYKHDFKELLKSGKTDFAYDIYQYSKGVLRYEVTMRSKALQQHFNTKDIKISDLTQDKVLSLLKYFFKKLIKSTNRKFMNSDEVLEKLKVKYKKQKALHLWQFYKIYHSDKKSDRKIINREYDRRSIWRLLRDISRADIGLPIKDIFTDYDLNIPSEYATNRDSEDEALASSN